MKQRDARAGERTDRDRLRAQGPVPLVLGVTGHRDVPETDRAAIREGVRSIIGEFRAQYPASPLRLLAMLASGADSIAAEAALAEGIPLIGLLPFELGLYREDFAIPEDRDRFERLWADCAERYEMPLLPGSSLSSVAEKGRSRDEQYAFGGAFVVRYSNSLIAIWDGVDPGLKGGTADMVRAQLCASPNSYLHQADFLSGRRTGPVYWIHARRTRNPDAPRGAPERLPFDCARIRPLPGSHYELLFPAGWRYGCPDAGAAEDCGDARRYYEGLLSSIDSFNRDALGRGARKEETAPRGSAESRDSPGASSIQDLHIIADGLAKRFQKRAHRSVFFLIAIGAATFAQMVVFDELINSAYMLLAFFASLLATWLSYRLIRRFDWDGKYFDYRSLAELARVIESLRKIGLAVDPTDLTTTKQQGLLGWVADAVRSLSMPSFFSRPTATEADRAEFLSRWVDDQVDYYEKGIVKRRKALGPRKRLRFSLLSGAMLSAFCFFAIKLAASLSGLDRSPWWDFRAIKGNCGVFSILTALCQAAFDIFLSAGAAVALYMDMRAFEDEIRLFGRAAIVFRRASALMHAALDKGDLATFSSLAVDLAREAVGENFEWNDDHRSAPLEMPMG